MAENTKILKNTLLPLKQPSADTAPSTSYNPFWQSTLFNEVYLLNDVPTKYAEMWQLDEHGAFADFCSKFQDLCVKLKGFDLDSWSERNTINRFIKPVLKMLGYLDKCSGDQEPWAEDEPFSVKEGGQSKIYKPDLIIVNDPKELKYIERKKGQEKLDEARASVVIPIEVKYWARIDELRKHNSEDTKRADKKDQNDATRALDFDEQCLKYMEILNKDFGILTDGKTWCLYHRELSADNYHRCFQFNLGHLVKHVNAGIDKDQNDYKQFWENAKYFFHIFSKKAVYSESGERLFLDELIEYSKKYVTQVEEDLKDRFVKAMAYACNGYQRAAKSTDLELFRNVAESNLFNILFIKHCEARNILPLKQSAEYRQISLSNIIDKLEHYRPEKQDDDLNLAMLRRMFLKDFKFEPDGTEIYERLIKLTKTMQDGTSKEYKSFEIKAFTKTIFSNTEWTFTQKNKLTNEEMIAILFELGYCKAGTKYQQIPYNFFSPRQLGSIYESFLGFRLDKATESMAFIKKQWVPANLYSDKLKHLDVPKVKKGGLFFSPDNEDRKATGSYYTPDCVVQYIVQETLAPLVREVSSKDISKLRVCDPAMGSGHFLNAALTYLSRSYLAALEKETNDDLTITIQDAKRLLLPHVIFGVDINPRAVKLAKMGLWLESAGAGKQLGELDNQLRCVNSLADDNLWKSDWKFYEKGLDAIVGNPPYIRSAKIELQTREYLRKRFKTATSAYDIFVLFFELAGEILVKNGRLGLIISNKLAVADYANVCRKMLITEWSMEHLIDFTRCDKVFPDASVVPMIVIARKEIPPPPKHQTLLISVPENDGLQAFPNFSQEVKLVDIIGNNNNFELFHTDFSKQLLSKIFNSSKPLTEIEDVRTGIMGFEYWKHEPFIESGVKFNKDKHWKLITPGLIRKFESLWTTKELRLYKQKYSRPVMCRNDTLLSKNTRSLFDSKKVVIRGVGRGIAAFYDTEGLALLVAVHCINAPKFPYFYEALFNSTLVNWLYCTTLLAGKIPQGSLKFPVNFIESIPVREDSITEVESKIRKLGEKDNHGKLEKIDRLIAEHYNISNEEYQKMLDEVRKTIPNAMETGEEIEQDEADVA